MNRLLCTLSVCILGFLLPGAELQNPSKVCDLQVDLALLVDISSTVNGDEFVKLKSFLTTVVENINLALAQIALVTFNQQPRLEVSLNDCLTTQCLKDAIANMRRPWGSTYYAGALHLADDTVFTPEKGDRIDVEDVIVIITDGTHSPDAVDPALLRRIKVERDMRVVVVAVGNDADTDLVFDIATDPFYENVFFANTFTDLERVAGDMTQLYCVEGLSRPPPDYLLPESCVYDIGLLVDLSGSITETEPYYDNWVQLREFLKAFVKQVKERFRNVHIALEFFRNRGNVLFNLEDCPDYKCMHAQMKLLPVPWGSTFMKDAFLTMENDVIGGGQNRPDVDDLIILMTDGFPTNKEQMPTEVAKRLKDRKIRIYGIGVTANVNEDTMREVVSQPFNENYEPAENYRKMARRINDIIAKTCRVPKSSCNVTVDIAVVVDLSASVNLVSGGFDRLKLFVSGIADSITFPNARMAIVYVQDKATTFVRLNQCSNSACIRRLVNNFPEPKGDADVTIGLEKIPTEVFTPAAGDRPNAPNIVMLVTDGVMSSAPARPVPPVGADTRIIVLPVSQKADIKSILQLASTPRGRNLIYSENYVDLVDNLPVIQDLICFAPTGPPPTPPPEPQICEYDIGLLVDVSGSIFYYDTKGNNFIVLRRFLETFVRRLKGLSRGDVKIAIEYFSDDAKVLALFDSCDNNRDVQCLVDSIWKLPKNPYAETKMRKGFEVMRDTVFRASGDRPNIQDLIILISDGFPEPFEPNNPIPVTNQIKDAMGIRIMGVGVTDRVNASIMRQIVSRPPEDNFVPVADFPALERAVNQLINTSCQPIRIVRPCKGDIVFLLDSSGSMSLDDWDTMKTFVSHLTRRLPINQDSVRIGAVKFSTSYQPLFLLNDMDSQAQVEVAIRDATYLGRDTHTWEVLPFIEYQMFNARNGDRPDYPNLLVIFTDGGSQDPDSTIEAAKRIKAKVNCTVVQIGSQFDYRELTALTSDPIDRNLIKINSFATLQQKVDYLLNDILDSMCKETVTAAPQQVETEKVTSPSREAEAKVATSAPMEGETKKVSPSAIEGEYEVVTSTPMGGETGEVSSGDLEGEALFY